MKVSNIFKGDKVLWMVFFFLCLISIIEVFSASSGLTYKSQDYVGPIIYHTGTIVFGFIVAIITVHIPWRYFKLMTPFLLLFSIVTLLWVLLAGTKIGDAGRWINLFGFTFQPSEIAKGSLVLAVAQILSIMQDEDGADPKAIKYILVLSIPIIFLIFLENFSTAALLSIVIYLMMILGRVPMRQIGILTGIGFGVALMGLAFIWFAGHDKEELERMEKQQKIEMVAGVKKEKSFLDKVFHRADTWKSRLMKFADDKEVAPEDYDLDKDAQVAHANIAIASSNVLGKGPGNSEQRDFLAQAFSDFIFAIIIEEMGFVGSGLVVLLYIFLLFRAARIASRCEYNFPAFLVMGLGLLLVIQALFNMMVAVGLAPVTGQPLPLISKGGTSTIINCAYIGAMLSISRISKKPQSENAVGTVVPQPTKQTILNSEKIHEKLVCPREN